MFNQLTPLIEGFFNKKQNNFFNDKFITLLPVSFIAHQFYIFPMRLSSLSALMEAW